MTFNIICEKKMGRLGNQLIIYMCIRNNFNNYKIFNIEVDNNILDLEYEKNLNKNFIKTIEIKATQILPNFYNNIYLNNYNIKLSGYFQRFEYINNIKIKEELYNAFNKLQKIELINEIVVHIRIQNSNFLNKKKQEEIHPGYPIIPIKIYKNLLKDVNMPIRFICESLEGEYIKLLKKIFPNAKFQNSSILNDFITIMSAKKIIMSVSTFCWCASYLNKFADEIIFPKYGIFHPNWAQDLNAPWFHNCNFQVPEKRFKYINLENEKVKRWYGSPDDLLNIMKL